MVQQKEWSYELSRMNRAIFNHGPGPSIRAFINHETRNTDFSNIKMPLLQYI